MDENRLTAFAEKTKKLDPTRHELWAEMVAILKDQPFEEPARVPVKVNTPSAPTTPSTPSKRTYTQAEVDAMKAAYDRQLAEAKANTAPQS